MTIQDKIAELPMKPLPRSLYPYLRPSEQIANDHAIARRVLAERDLALEVLRNFLEHSDGCQTILSTDLPCTCGANDARAVLAACGGESHE